MQNTYFWPFETPNKPVSMIQATWFAHSFKFMVPYTFMPNFIEIRDFVQKFFILLLLRKPAVVKTKTGEFTTPDKFLIKRICVTLRARLAY